MQGLTQAVHELEKPFRKRPSLDSGIATLLQLSEQAKQGADLSKLSYGEQVGNQYRYMKAIAIAEPCLACHGTDVKQPVRDMLKQHYPNDKAIGFNAGDLRGAFSLSTPIS